MNIVNMTPHEIKVVGQAGSVIGTFQPSGQIARLEVVRAQRGLVQGIPLYVSEVGQASGLPEAIEGRYLIVSTLVRTSFPARKDLLSPGELVRDDKGQPIGCKGFDRN